MIGILWLLLCFIVYGSSCIVGRQYQDNSANHHAAQNICSTESCRNTSSKILEYMDESINPCDDFYEFACGKFVRRTTIPEDKSSVTPDSLTQDKVDEQIEAILTEEPDSNEKKPVKLAKIFTKTCLDEASMIEKGIKPLVDILEKYGGWPVVKGDAWQSDHFDWLERNKGMSRDGLLDSPILEWQVSVDLKNSSRRIFQMTGATFIFLSREFLLKGMEDPFVKAYYDFMVDAAVIFGANRKSAEIESLDVLQFEMELAKVTLSQEEKRNQSTTYNPFTIKELQIAYPFINWLEYIEWNLRDLVHVDEKEVIIVREPNYLSQLDAILQSTSKRTIANYYAWQVVSRFSNHLNDVLRERYEKYDAAITGREKPLPRLKECVGLTKTYLSISVAASYVRRYFNQKIKEGATQLSKSIHEEFMKTLRSVPWIDEKSRAAAIIKANNIGFHVAFPDELVDDNKLEEYYRDVELQPDSLLHNIIELNKFFMVRSVRRLRKPVNKTDWKAHSSSTEVNAFYSPPENSVELPAAVLQSPFFSAESPAYLNFAAIGWFVAHEITHGFDDEGRQFDSDGNVMNWWQEDTINKFTTRAQCFIEQYSNFSHPTLNITVNGVITQGENIADNGAVKGAYAAYQEFRKQNGPDLGLPDLNYSSNQLFWISAAQLWCSVTRPESERSQYTTNPHAPSRFRVIGTFRNTQNFANDFNCAPGTEMNPVDKCEVW